MSTFIDAISAPFDRTRKGTKFSIQFPIRPTDIPGIIIAVKNQQLIEKESLIRLVAEAEAILAKQPTLRYINVPPGTVLSVVGDVHSKLFDVLDIFIHMGQPSKTNLYLFNGDLIDRGSYGLEIVILLFAIVVAIPDTVFLNRGNHESYTCTLQYGFQEELRSKGYPDCTAGIINAFEKFPVATVVNLTTDKPALVKKIFVVHGGIPQKPETETLAEIAKIPRFCEPEGSLLGQLLWADPNNNRGLGDSMRPFCRTFGGDITERFLKKNGLDFVIRSHEVVNGHLVWQTHAGGRLMTLFTARDTQCEGSNSGEWLVLTGGRPLPEAMDSWTFRQIHDNKGHPDPLYTYQPVGCYIM